MKAWGCAPISANLFLHIAPLAIGVDIEGLSRDTDWKPMLLYAGVSMPWVREGRLLRHRSKLRRAMKHRLPACVPAQSFSVNADRKRSNLALQIESRDQTRQLW